MLKYFLLLFLLGGLRLYSQVDDYARGVVNELASAKFMGRGYIRQGDLKAADYIRNEFRNSGLQSEGENYFQYFNLDVNTFPGRMKVKLEDQWLRPGVDFIVDPASGPLKANLSVISVQRIELLDPEKVKNLKEGLAGKAVLINMNDSLTFSKEEQEKLNALVESIKYSPEFKNLLTIVYSDKKLTWSIAGWESLKASLTFNSNNIKEPDIHQICVDIQTDFKKEYRTQNVTALIRGTEIPDSFLVITAHYDHLGIMGKGTVFPGANDNASGVAMLLGLSRYYALHPPKYSMLFIAFSGEEAGLLGSAYFVKHPLVNLSDIRFLVNFDLAGTGDEGIKVVNGSIFKPEFDRLKKLNEEGNLLSSVQPRGEACISDHCFFYMSKVPCFYIYTLGGIQAYHDVYDRPETLPLTEIEDYSVLMIKFFDGF